LVCHIGFSHFVRAVSNSHFIFVFRPTIVFF
jgi:hypothetical protein